MIQHYLKIAFRNMWKYKSQTLVSVVGLAVGFVCFAMAALWIRYEMTYDNFHRKIDRIYCVNMPNFTNPNRISRDSPQPLPKYLKATFPEIANAITIESGPVGLKRGDDWIYMDILNIDSSFFSMFDLDIVEGNMEFLIHGSEKMAITRKKALQLFGNESPIGKKLGNITICAVVEGWSKHTNYPFDVITAVYVNMNWTEHREHTLVELAPNVDVEAFKKKLFEHTIEEANITNITLTPLATVHYKDPNVKREVKFQHILLFALSAALLIMCTLFNYLTLFVGRFRTRQREFALRMVYGASGRSLLAMLSTEFALSMIAALLLGMFLISNVIEPFRAISGTKSELSEIYLESAAYIAFVIAIALVTFVLILAFFRRRTLSANIRSNKKIFRKTSIVVQLIVSIVFAFCTAIILKQMYYLHNTDLGFAFKNRGSVSIATKFDNIKMLNDKILQIPEIEETVIGYLPLATRYFGIWDWGAISNWDERPKNAENVHLNCLGVSEQYIDYYEFKLVEGEMLNDTDNADAVMINQAAAKAFGWKTAVGKSFEGGYQVKGVINDVYCSAPTVSAPPCFYFQPHDTRDGKKYRIAGANSCVLFKYSGKWKTCFEKIKAIVDRDFPNSLPEFYNTEEEYNRFLKSENMLLKILTLISFVCIIVCIFGFVSMVSLTCEERRKEIAIRKINGATLKDILDIFLKEHLTLLAVGAAIAFPAGYIIMKQWLEQYVVQTEMSAWVYVAILLVLIIAIVLCVGGKVWRTSRENPINAIK